MTLTVVDGSIRVKKQAFENKALTSDPGLVNSTIWKIGPKTISPARIDPQTERITFKGSGHRNHDRTIHMPIPTSQLLAATDNTTKTALVLFKVASTKETRGQTVKQEKHSDTGQTPNAFVVSRKNLLSPPEGSELLTLSSFVFSVR